MTNTTLITILTRVSRPQLFNRLQDSIDYPVTHTIYDDTLPREKEPFDWNLHCNKLKSQVNHGYFLFADDDDYFVPGALAELANHLTDGCDGVIVQFLRNGRPKPSLAAIMAKLIVRGKIGGGCLVLAARHKFIADWKAKEGADFDWIKEVSEKIELRFVPLVVQVAGNNGLKGEKVELDNYERKSL